MTGDNLCGCDQQVSNYKQHLEKEDRNKSSDLEHKLQKQVISKVIIQTVGETWNDCFSLSALLVYSFSHVHVLQI